MHWTKHIYNTILLRNPPLLATQLTTMMNLTPLRRVKKLRITTNMRIIVIEHQQLSHSHHSQLAPPQLQLILTKLCFVNWNMNRLSSGGWKLQCSHHHCSDCCQFLQFFSRSFGSDCLWSSNWWHRRWHTSHVKHVNSLISRVHLVQVALNCSRSKQGRNW